MKSKKAEKTGFMYGFPIWDNATCGHCEFKVPEDDKENYLFKIECPTCGREGCDECIPGGRGCECIDCLDSG